MALLANESFTRGFVFNQDGAVVTTTSQVSAAFIAGFLRDPDGRLVVQSG